MLAVVGSWRSISAIANASVTGDVGRELATLDETMSCLVSGGDCLFGTHRCTAVVAYRVEVIAVLLSTHTGPTLQAERLVRDASQFKWYAVTLLALVLWAYANELERGRLDIVAAGLAVWFADWFNEIVNAVVLHATNRAPLWATTGPTAYQFLVGLNVEICFMFALAGIIYAKLLPRNRAVRVLGLPNRVAVALGLSLVSVAVELFLHATGTFHWEYWWWNVASFPVIVVFGYLWFFLFGAWVYDAPSQTARWRRVGGLAAIDIALMVVFGAALGWL